MKIFTLRPDSFAIFRKKMIKRMTVVGIIVLLILLVDGYFTIYRTGMDINQDWYLYLPVLLPFLMGFITVRSVIRRQKKLFETYQLTIEDLVITREQYNTPTITMYLDEIIEITKFKNGSFIIRSKRMHDTIGVPSQIDHKEELEQLLNQIHPVSSKSKGAWTLYIRPLTFVLGMALLITVNTVDNKIVVLTAGILLTICFGLYVYFAQVNKNINNRAKQSSWLVLLLLCIELYMIYIKLKA